jgi:hypothetical protein
MSWQAPLLEPDYGCSVSAIFREMLKVLQARKLRTTHPLLIIPVTERRQSCQDGYNPANDVIMQKPRDWLPACL